jgi:TonB-dependent receptor
MKALTFTYTSAHVFKEFLTYLYIKHLQIQLLKFDDQDPNIVKNRLIKKTPLYTGIAFALAAVVSAPLYAQDQNDAEDEMVLEEVVVTGVRASLIESMDRKRVASGIVDAITAEDIADFPDTNLAEALQRIPGVSIDRVNGEGSKITVRGMGPEFNLVTLNGRSMPNAGSRSFDFADIATEAVSAVEIYKTAKAGLPTGGIGATINMITARPLDKPGFRAVLGAKALYENSASDSDDLNKFTPEVSGMLSTTFADDTMGLMISGSYQKRNNREEEAHIAAWIPNRDIGGQATIEDNNLREDGTNWYPQDTGFGWADITRKRTNARIVLQWQPTDSLDIQLDYTYAEVDFEKDANGFGIWFLAGGSSLRGVVNERGTFTSVTETGGDYATGVSRDHTKKKNDSLGLNIEWQATDTLSFNLDIADSSSKNKGDGLGSLPGSSANLIIGNTSCDWCASPTANIAEKGGVYGGNGLPGWDIAFVSQGPDGGPQEELLPSDLGSLFGQAFDTDVKNDITQVQLHSTWDVDGDSLSNIDFGVAYTNQKFRSSDAYSGQLPAGWWNTSAQYWADDQWQRNDTSGMLDDFSNSGDYPVDYYYTADFDYIVDQYEQVGANDPDLGTCCYWPSWGPDFQGEGRGYFNPGPLTGDSEVKEKITSAYINFEFHDEISGMPFNAMAGVRYEKSKVKSKGLETPATALVWVGGNEWVYEFAEDKTFSDGGGTTKQFLPSLDTSLEFKEDWIGRFSYSRSLARPPIDAMNSTRNFVGNPLLTNRKVEVGNPGLKPYVSDNFDLSLEWYYAEGSYASVAYFYKIVDNFLVTQTTQRPVDGLLDAYYGDLANQARAELLDEGMVATDANTFDRMNQILGNDSLSAIYPVDGDPLAIFDVTSTTNAETGILHGWEFSVQHLFGDSGFGIVANATLVGGDVSADRDTVNQQFALPGLSDSANFTVFYENDHISTRFAYNWRDEFLAGFDAYSSPIYTESYSQLDFNFTWFATENLSVFVDGINITSETQRQYVRYEEQFLRGNQYGSRWMIGARYRF